MSTSKESTGECHDASNESAAVSSIAQKLMEKMGWKSGSGLGKHSQGMANFNSLWSYRRNARCKKGFKSKEETLETLPHQNAFEDLLGELGSQINDGSNSNKSAPSSSGMPPSLVKRRSYRNNEFRRVANYSPDDMKGIIGSQITNKWIGKYSQVSTEDRYKIVKLAALAEENDVSEQGKAYVYERRKELLAELRRQKKNERRRLKRAKKLRSKESEGQSHLCQEIKTLWGSDSSDHELNEQNESLPGAKMKKRKVHRSSFLNISGVITLENANTEEGIRVTVDTNADLVDTSKHSKKGNKWKAKISSSIIVGKRTKLKDAIVKREENVALECDVTLNNVNDSSNCSSGEMRENKNDENLVGHINEPQTENDNSSAFQTRLCEHFQLCDKQEYLKKHLGDHPQLVTEIAGGFVGSNLMDIKGYGN